MKRITLLLSVFLYTATVFAASPEDGIYMMLPGNEANLSPQERLHRFHESAQVVIAGGEVVSQQGIFFYTSECSGVNPAGKTQIDLAYTTLLKKEDGLFLLTKNMYISPSDFVSYSIYNFIYLYDPVISTYNLYGRDIIYGAIRFDTPDSATMSLTSAQAYFSGEGLEAASCIAQAEAVLVKVQ